VICLKDQVEPEKGVGFVWLARVFDLKRFRALRIAPTSPRKNAVRYGAPWGHPLLFRAKQAAEKFDFLLRLRLWQGLKPILFSSVYGTTKVVP
jgi:hypothetical protein